MTDQFMTPRRTVPLHVPEWPERAAEDTAKNNDLQQDAEVFSNVQEQAFSSPEEHTISVEQVRDHFRQKGLSKSKDTVQRWCRTGELSCQKRGVLGRYFTTETSLLKLEQKLLPDMIAENAGASQPSETEVPPHAAEDSGVQSDMQGHTPADADVRSGTQPEMQVHASERTDADTPTATADVARLTAEVAGLQSQLENRDKQIDFLQEEIRAGRDQRGAVVQISNRMLETLETMAIGGRLERPNQQASAGQKFTEPVRVEHRETPRDGV